MQREQRGEGEDKREGEQKREAQRTAHRADGERGAAERRSEKAIRGLEQQWEQVTEK